MNSVCVSGTIKSEIKFGYTQANAARASVIVAVARPGARGQPGKQIMIRVKAWDNYALTLKEAEIGEKIEIQGYLDTYEDRAGNWQTDVTATSIMYPDRRAPVKIKEEET